MGQQCCIEKRNSFPHSSFSLKEELEYLQNMQYTSKRSYYCDKPLVDLLGNLDLHNESILSTTLSITDKGTEFDFSKYNELSHLLIEEMISKCQETQNWNLQCDLKNTQSSIKLFIRQIECIKGSKVNATKCQFIVPGQPQNFISLMGNFKKQKEIDSRIDQFYSIAKKEQESIIYLSYKQVLMASPRDFLYYKISKELDNKIWCESSRSIEDSYFPPKNKVRGDIKLSGYVIQSLSNLSNDTYFNERFSQIQDKQKYSFVTMYSECDFKVSVPYFLAKGQIQSEMIKYINSLFQILQQQ